MYSLAFASSIDIQPLSSSFALPNNRDDIFAKLESVVGTRSPSTSRYFLPLSITMSAELAARNSFIESSSKVFLIPSRDIAIKSLAICLMTAAFAITSSFALFCSARSCSRIATLLSNSVVFKLLCRSVISLVRTSSTASI